jgi:hypothetical protein
VYTLVASKVKETSRGQPRGASPSVSAVKEFFEKVDSDPGWFPGKASDTRRGPKRLLRGAKVTAIVSAAKRIKAEGDEPTYSAVVAACPRATLNPSTNEPVDKRLVCTIFRECCDDATVMYAYPYTLCRRGIVATFDLSASNLDMFETDHWLSNEKNCLVLRLTQPAFVTKQKPADVGGHLPKSRTETMRSWSVGELASFFAKRDMEGPAQRLRVQGVAGEDFVDFTPELLQQDLRFPAFTARKLLRIRDAYLEP